MPIWCALHFKCRLKKKKVKFTKKQGIKALNDQLAPEQEHEHIHCGCLKTDYANLTTILLQWPEHAASIHVLLALAVLTHCTPVRYTLYTRRIH